jgi:hypothetical protein
MENKQKLTQVQKDLLQRYGGQTLKDKSSLEWARILNVSEDDFKLHFKEQV